MHSKVVSMQTPTKKRQGQSFYAELSKTIEHNDFSVFLFVGGSLVDLSFQSPFGLMAAKYDQQIGISSGREESARHRDCFMGFVIKNYAGPIHG
jgi:hypothetical protein